MPFRTRVWAAVLYAGAGAVASHGTAAWLDGLHDEPPRRLDVTVPERRRVRPRPGLRIHRSISLERAAHPVRSPPRTRVEDTVLDLVATAVREVQVIDAVLRACQRRLTTAARLAAAAAARPALRWRALVDELLDDVRDGVASALERRWRRDVEIPHGLPRGERNRPERCAGRTAFRDVRYRRFRLVVELDGRAAHPPEAAHLDRARDRALAESIDERVRFGWVEVAGSRCECAAQTARLLRKGGWDGTARACGPRCPIGSVRNIGVA